MARDGFQRAFRPPLSSAASTEHEAAADLSAKVSCQLPWQTRRMRLGLSPRFLTWFAVWLLVVGSGFLLVRAAWADSVTNDEALYIHSAECAFNARLIDLETSNPAGPKLLAGLGIELSGVPTDHNCTTLAYQTLLPSRAFGSLRRLVLFARLPAIAVTLALVLVCAWWAFRLGGRPAAVLAAAFVGFDPTVIAHGHLATLDIPLTFGVVASLASLWSWRQRPKARWLVASGLALGFALLSKASAVALFPLLIFILVATGDGTNRQRLRAAIKPSALIGAIAYLELVVVYAPFRHVEPVHPWLPRGLNWLLPESWLWGARNRVDLVQSAKALTTYVNGHQHLGPTAIYYPEAFLLKTTIGELVAIALGTFMLLKRRNEALLWIVAPGFLYFASVMASGLELGVRYIVPSIVLFLVGAAVGLSRLSRLGAVAGAGLALAAMTATITGPVGSMGYFNALATRRHSYYVADSNIDWGQDGWRLRTWWEAHGRPLIQVDFFGGLPARVYVPTALDVGLHTERSDDTPVPVVRSRVLIVSVNSGTLESRHAAAVAAARCYIGTSLVVVGATC